MITDCKLFEINSFDDERGGLSFIEEGEKMPFSIQRVYYLYNTLAGVVRGVHAHKKLEQIIIAFSGKFEITLDDGDEQKTFILDKPNLGLYVSPMIWREVSPLEDGSVCVVLASRKYEADDYIHEYRDFKNLIHTS
jgi:dTDP-4-dehydrorhamnose 3,5-epimerase-like enzyme